MMLENTSIAQARPGHAAPGFSLLEVLIALVILSVGLLGIAAMLSTTLKSNDSAYMRSQATILAANIIDRMRANPQGVAGGDYNLSMGAAAPGSVTVCTGTTADCTALTLAQYDLTQWLATLASPDNGLPQGTGSITTTTLGGVQQVTVTVQWNDTRALAALQGSGTPPPAASTLSISSVL
ncbi:MAG: type IV pilus modification protein PilV [Gammaproteobacteria bacterium]